MAWRGVREVTDEMTEGQGQDIAVNLCWFCLPQRQNSKACPCHPEEKSNEEMGLDAVAHAPNSSTGNAGTGASH